MSKKAHHLFKNAHETDSTRTYIEVHKMDEQAAIKATYLGEADDQTTNMIGTLEESQVFKHLVIQQVIPSPTSTAPVTRLVKQCAEIVVSRKAKFCDHNIKQKPDEDQNTSPSPLFVALKLQLRLLKTLKGKTRKKHGQIHRRSLPVRN